MAFQQWFGAVADLGWDLITLQAGGRRLEHSSLAGLCEVLLSQKGEATGIAIARQIIETYPKLDRAQRLAFFFDLLELFGPKPDAILDAAEAYRATADDQALLALAQAVTPPRRDLFHRINMAPGATAALVSLREDLLHALSEHPNLTPVDRDLKQQFESWFNRGFLNLERISWNTPAAILEMLIRYEAVHQITGWGDLRRRLAPDRRCYGFFHPALGDEPLIFVQVALSRGIAESIQPLIGDDAPETDPTQADTAVFFSISNCQEGLRGISFGNFLIKQVVVDLQTELPRLKHFVTLSPIPGFMDWLSARSEDMPALIGAEAAQAIERVNTPLWHQDPALANAVKDPLRRLCAHYLVEAKTRGRPLDPVARFHLGNGAKLQQINWLGDVSAKGLRQSAGMMVNYAYVPSEIVRNHEAYFTDKKVVASKSVLGLARQIAPVPEAAE